MISNNNRKKVSIYITTFEKEYKNTATDDMNQDKNNKKDLTSNFNNRFICSICLNTKNDEFGKMETACPICRKNCEVCATKEKRVHKRSENMRSHSNAGVAEKEPNTKVVQTSKTNVTQGLDLLNEVLTVFQNKKQIDVQKIKSFKDVATSTERNANKNVEKLSLSKIQQFSIADDKVYENFKFTTVNYCQPENCKRPQHVIDLIRHKSSSIPQMKLDELKKSVKEKTKSKDAIEEVNRMFANVRRYEPRDNLEETNRPMIRNGPRVLPVVKTCNHANADQIENRNEKDNKQTCKCCQTKDYNMSSGDSVMKPGCRHNFGDEIEKCTNCVYRLCCHYQNNCKKTPICKDCRNVRDSCCQHEKHSRSNLEETG